MKTFTLSISTSDSKIQDSVRAGYTHNRHGLIANQDRILNDGFFNNADGSVAGTYFELFSEDGVDSCKIWLSKSGRVELSMY